MMNPTRSLLLTVSALVLTACAAGGVSDDVPLRTIGPDAKSKGLVSNDEGRIVLFNSEQAEKQQEIAEKTGGDDESYQEWKARKDQEDYEAWKREQDAKAAK